MALWVMHRGTSGALQISSGVDASSGHLIRSFHTPEAQSRMHSSGTFCRKQANRCSFLLHSLSSREILAGDDWWVITCLILPYKARLYYRVLQIVKSFKEQINSQCLPTKHRGWHGVGECVRFGIRPLGSYPSSISVMGNCELLNLPLLQFQL